METGKSAIKIKRVLCPTDLSTKSQLTVGFAARLAEKLASELTICHCAENKWLSSDNHLSDGEVARIKNSMNETVGAYRTPQADLKWQSLIIENSLDPARDIINLAKKTAADLIVMKARKGVLSAFHYGSIVERVTRGAWCPVLLIPSRFLETDEATRGDLNFRNILLDYEFLQEDEKLLRLVLGLTAGFRSKLHLLKVLEPPQVVSTEMAQVNGCQKILQEITSEKLRHLIPSEQQKSLEVSTTVEWGKQAATVLDYASKNGVDLICATLPPPHFYFEKMYSVYLGKLLQKATCPVLVLQAHGNQAPVYFKPVLCI